jgi:hypothetical protein
MAAVSIYQEEEEEKSREGATLAHPHVASLNSQSIIEKGRMNASCVCRVNGMDADTKSNCSVSFFAVITMCQHNKREQDNMQ